MKNNVLVFNETEWRMQGWFTKEELDNADEKGYIGRKNGVECYLARFIKSNR